MDDGFSSLLDRSRVGEDSAQDCIRDRPSIGACPLREGTERGCGPPTIEKTTGIYERMCLDPERISPLKRSSAIDAFS